MAIDPEPEDMEILAAEYALRLLDGDDLTRADALLRDDPAFGRSVRMWEVRLAELTDEIDPVPPGPTAKRALMDTLFAEEKPAPLLDRLGFWKWISAAAVVLAAGLTIYAMTLSRTQTGPLYTAQIVSDAGDFRAVVVVDKTTNELILARTDGAAPQGRILQVWAHGPNAPALSVGLWPEGDTVRLAMPAVIADVEGTLTVGVSEEPQGGSSTGSPSGRVFGTVDIENVSPRP